MKEGNQEDLFEFELSILASSIPGFLIQPSCILAPLR
jgi:hypothetical protein